MHPDPHAGSLVWAIEISAILGFCRRLGVKPIRPIVYRAPTHGATALAIAVVLLGPGHTSMSTAALAILCRDGIIE